jgi:hypothetical protein
MATVAGIKIKTKVAKPRGGQFMDEKYTGGEPQWDTERAEQFDNATFDHHLRKSFYYYNYYYTQKDCKKHVVEWMQTQPTTFSKTDISAFIRSSDRNMSMTACSLIMAHRVGMPFRGRHIEFIVEAINRSIALASPEDIESVAVEVAKPYVPTIQDRLAEKTSEIIGELEGKYDLVSVGEKIDFKPYDYFVANNVVQSQLGKYETVYTKRRAELELAMTRQDEDLQEGYRHYKAADFKRMISWIDSLLAAVEQYRDVKRATKKARVKKAPSKEKLISRLKYAKEHKELKIVSVNPADIIGSTELWVYNVKTRKIGRYIAEEYKTLSVKGTTIINYSEQRSTSKTLRKPEEKLKEFARAGKIQLRKFLDEIRATETLLNGRINADIVLLKVA